MGILLANEGKYVAARGYLERALKVYEQIENPKHPKLVPILFNLGSVMLYMRQFVPARRF